MKKYSTKNTYHRRTIQLYLQTPIERFKPNFASLFILSLLILFGSTHSASVLAQDDRGVNVPPTDLDITIGTLGPENGPLVVGTSFDWEIQIRWYGDLDAINPQIQKSPKLTGLKQVKQSTTIRTGAEGERRYAEKVFRYTLRPISEGEASIGTAAIRTGAAGEGDNAFLSTTPATFTVNPAPFSLSKWLLGLWEQTWFRILFLTVLILLILCVTLSYWKRYKNASAEEPIETIDPVEEAFERARRYRIEGDRSKFIRSLKQAIETSLSRNYPDVDPQDSLMFRERLDVELQIVYDRFYEQSEHIQFAPASPSPDELDRALNDAKRLTGME